jgi:hypothetical protein
MTSLSGSLLWLPRVCHRCILLSRCLPALVLLEGFEPSTSTWQADVLAAATTTVLKMRPLLDSREPERLTTAHETVSQHHGATVENRTLTTSVRRRLLPNRQWLWYPLTESNCHCHRVKVASSPLNEEGIVSLLLAVRKRSAHQG